MARFAKWLRRRTHAIAYAPSVVVQRFTTKDTKTGGEKRKPQMNTDKRG
jgi:hypothetical protein